MTLRNSNIYMLLVCAYSACTQCLIYSVFHPVVPYYLRTLFNDTGSCQNMTPCAETEAHISTTIGIISGSGSTVQLLSSICSGFLLQWFSLWTNLLISAALNLTSPLTAFFADGVVAMCAANAAISSGQILTFVTYYSLFSERSRDHKDTIRYLGAMNIANGVGFIIGYSAASASYQFIGHRATFGALCCLQLIDVLLRISLHTGSRHNETFRTVVEKKHWSKLVTDQYIVLASIQCFVLYMTITFVWSTAPNFLATQLQAQQWELGITMGVASCVELIVLVVSTAVVTSNGRRSWALFGFYLASGAGLLVYPFVKDVWQAIAPEILLKGSKGAALILVATLYPYIVECRGTGTSKMAYASLSIVQSIAGVLGFFTSGVFVVLLTFQWLYVGLAIAMLLLLCTILPFRQLKPSNMAAINVAELASL